MQDSVAEAVRSDAKPPAPAVGLTDVTITFRMGKGATYTAVDKATLSVADGEFVAIVGPTGCGKSTLLNVAAGLLTPSAGTADIFGEHADRPESAIRLSVPGRLAVSLEDLIAERRDRSRDRGRRVGRSARRARRTG